MLHSSFRLISKVVEHVSEFNPRAIANTLWALATGGVQLPASLVECLSQRAVSTARDFKPQGIANWRGAAIKPEHRTLQARICKCQSLGEVLETVSSAKSMDAVNISTAVHRAVKHAQAKGEISKLGDKRFDRSRLCTINDGC